MNAFHVLNIAQGKPLVNTIIQFLFHRNVCNFLAYPFVIPLKFMISPLYIGAYMEEKRISAANLAKIK